MHSALLYHCIVDSFRVSCPNVIFPGIAFDPALFALHDITSGWQLQLMCLLFNHFPNSGTNKRKAWGKTNKHLPRTGTANKFTLVFNALFDVSYGDSSVVSINDRIPSVVHVTNFLLGLFNCCPLQKPDSWLLLPQTWHLHSCCTWITSILSLCVCISARVHCNEDILVLNVVTLILLAKLRMLCRAMSQPLSSCCPCVGG